jgi:hypothetical protein
MGCPDYIDPVVGWRSWVAVDQDGEVALASLFLPAVWPAGEPLAAVCVREQPANHWTMRWFGRKTHPAPSEGCECGIYGVRASRFRIRRTGSGEAGRRVVFGRVSLWGLVHEHDAGWRASHAYPEELYVPRCGGDDEEADRVAAALARYRVPVTVVASPSRRTTVPAR